MEDFVTCPHCTGDVEIEFSDNLTVGSYKENTAKCLHCNKNFPFAVSINYRLYVFRTDGVCIV